MHRGVSWNCKLWWQTGTSLHHLSYRSDRSVKHTADSDEPVFLFNIHAHRCVIRHSHQHSPDLVWDHYPLSSLFCSYLIILWTWWSYRLLATQKSHLRLVPVINCVVIFLLSVLRRCFNMLKSSRERRERKMQFSATSEPTTYLFLHWHLGF